MKCRPPRNRKPLPDEATACLPYLHRQIALVQPKVLLALGGTAAEWLLGREAAPWATCAARCIGTAAFR